MDQILITACWGCRLHCSLPAGLFSRYGQPGRLTWSPEDDFLDQLRSQLLVETLPPLFASEMKLLAPDGRVHRDEQLASPDPRLPDVLLHLRADHGLPRCDDATPSKRALQTTRADPLVEDFFEGLSAASSHAIAGRRTGRGNGSPTYCALNPCATVRRTRASLNCGKWTTRKNRNPHKMVRGRRRSAANCPLLTPPNHSSEDALCTTAVFRRSYR